MWMTRIAVVILRMRRSGSGRDACLFFFVSSLSGTVLSWILGIAQAHWEET